MQSLAEAEGELENKIALIRSRNASGTVCTRRCRRSRAPQGTDRRNRDRRGRDLLRRRLAHGVLRPLAHRPRAGRRGRRRPRAGARRADRALGLGVAEFNDLAEGLRDAARSSSGASKERDEAERERARAASELETRSSASTRRASSVNATRRDSSVTLSSIGDAVIATDAKGRVTVINPVAQALTGWPSRRHRPSNRRRVRHPRRPHAPAQSEPVSRTHSAQRRDASLPGRAHRPGRPRDPDRRQRLPDSNRQRHVPRPGRRLSRHDGESATRSGNAWPRSSASRRRDARRSR